MKNLFIKSLVLILCLTFTNLSTAKAIDYETDQTYITDQYLINGDIDIMQISESIADEAGDFNDCEGLNLYNETSGRYHTSIETSRYGSDISINKGIVCYTYTSKVKPGNSKTEQSWRPNTSGVRMLRIESSCTSLQGDNYNPQGNYYLSEGNHYTYTESDELYSKALLLSGIGCRTNSAG